MGRKPFPRNLPCPCGSGVKYKKCCYTKGFHYVLDEATGEVGREVPLNEEMADAIQAQRQKFVDKFGMEPGPDDKLFFDLDEGDFESKTVEAMKKAGIPPAFIHAFQRTGLIVTEKNRHLIPERDLEEYEEAIEEYHALHGERN